MMRPITEGKLRFDFPEGWNASKFDEWSFYRNQFMKLSGASLQCSTCETGVRCEKCGSKNVAGTKGVDILAAAPGGVSWFIEVKDYRQTRESSFEFLADEVALKVRDTLACLVTAQIHASEAAHKDLARACVRGDLIRVVLHLEQPDPRSRLDSKRSRRASVLQRLKQLVKAVDPRPLVLDRSDTQHVDWTVTLLGSPSS